MSLPIKNIYKRRTGIEFDITITLGGDDYDFGFPFEIALEVEVEMTGEEVVFSLATLLLEDGERFILPSESSILSSMNRCETLRDYVKNEAEEPVAEYLQELAADEGDWKYELHKQAKLDGELS